jgi:hypothetical protein
MLKSQQDFFPACMTHTCFLPLSATTKYRESLSCQLHLLLQIPLFTTGQTFDFHERKMDILKLTQFNI